MTIALGQTKIEATGGHPFWVLEGEGLEDRPVCDCLPACEQGMTASGRWVYARELRIGDAIRNLANKTTTVTGLKLYETVTTVYNFEVDDLHNYAVGECELLVHNNNGPELPKGTPKSPKEIKWADKADEPVRKQLKGKGQIAGFEGSPNVRGYSARDLLNKTPRQLENMVKNGELPEKILKQIKKLFEGRNLGK